MQVRARTGARSSLLEADKVMLILSKKSVSIWVIVALVLLVVGVRCANAQTLIDSYDDANADAMLSIYSGGRLGVAQSFTNTSSDMTLLSVTFYIYNNGATTGNAYAKVWTHAGTYGTSSAATASPLATSDAVDVTTITGGYVAVSFAFSGANQITLDADAYYIVSVEYQTGDITHRLQVHTDESTPSHGGNAAASYDIATPTWTAMATQDAVFYVYGETYVAADTCCSHNASATDTIDFGEVDTVSTSDEAWILTNCGLETLADDAGISGHPYFAFVGDSAWSIAADESDTLTFRFSPTTSGVVYSDVIAGHDSCGGVVLMGEGIPIAPLVYDTFHVYEEYDGMTQGEADTLNIHIMQDSVGPGSTVFIHPGTYAFCVQMTTSGSAVQPITYKASNADSMPLFDLSAYENFNSATDTRYPPTDYGMFDWQGSPGDSLDWGAGDGIAPHISSGNWDRGCIVVWNAGYINIEDIEFKNVYNSGNDCNAIRVVADDGPVNITRCNISYCTNGIDVHTDTDGDADVLVTISYCDIGYCGRYPNGTGPGGHILYTHNGSMIVEYCYLHHATEGQLMHLRNKLAIIRYCWMEDPYSYFLDVCQVQDAPYPNTIQHYYIGNVFVDSCGVAVGSRTSSVMVVMEGGDNRPTDAYPPQKQELYLYYNTFLGIHDSRYLVKFAGTSNPHYWPYLPSLYMYNNIIWGNTAPLQMQFVDGLIDTVDIQYNWFPGAEGDYSSVDTDSTNFANNVFGSYPGFVDTTGGDYTLLSTAEVIGEANSSLGELPSYEYSDALGGVARTAWAALGAYEAGGGTGTGIAFGSGGSSIPTAKKVQASERRH